MLSNIECGFVCVKISTIIVLNYFKILIPTVFFLFHNFMGVLKFKTKYYLTKYRIRKQNIELENKI